LIDLYVDWGVNEMRSVERAFDVMFQIVQSDQPSTPSSLANDLDLPRATVHRMLAVLVSCGVITRASDEKSFVVTPKLLLASLTNRRVARLSEFIVTYLHRLVALSEETSSLHVRSGDQRICVAEIEGSRGIRWARGPGWGAPIWSGAVGRMLMAGETRQEIDDIFARSSLDPLTTSTIVDPVEIRSRIDRARLDGSSCSASETVTGAAAVSAPLVTSDGRTIAVIGLYGPAERLDHMRTFSTEICSIAAESAAAWQAISTVPAEPAARQPAKREASTTRDGFQQGDKQ
jgi:IclR family acetate operon transcriptional repressor